MHRALRSGRARAAGVLVGVLAVASMLSGCGARVAIGGQAEEAQQLLRGLRLPAGARPLDSTGGLPTSFQSDELGCEGLVQREQYWRLPHTSIDAAQTWFERHVPPGLRSAGGASGGDRSGETMTEVEYTVGRTAGGSLGSRLVVMAVRDGAGSALRASAQIVPAEGCRSAHRPGPPTDSRHASPRDVATISSSASS